MSWLRRIMSLQPAPSAAAEEFPVEKMQVTVGPFHEEKRSAAEADPAAVKNYWLKATKSQLSQLSNRLPKLQAWIDRYDQASKVTQGSIGFHSWLSVMSLREDWQTQAGEIEHRLSNIRRDYNQYARGFKKVTGSFIAMQVEIRDAMGLFNTHINKAEANLRSLRGAQKDAKKRREEFEKIQNRAKEMEDCSVDLCQWLYLAIQELVKQLGESIKEQLEWRWT